MGGPIDSREFGRTHRPRHRPCEANANGGIHRSSVCISFIQRTALETLFWATFGETDIPDRAARRECPKGDGVTHLESVCRDLGTEGAEDADIQLRKCLSGPKPLIPGPRYFCANRAIIASGSYGASCIF